MSDKNGIIPTMPPAQLRIELYEGIRDGKLKHEQWAWFETAQFGEDVSFNRQHCGTTACAAGWASLLAAPAHAIVTAAGIELHGAGEDVNDFARKALGLSAGTATQLFYSSSNVQALDQLKWLAEHPEADTIPVAVLLDIREKAACIFRPENAPGSREAKA